jgi:outer membrane lipoprotein carrier protein
MLLAAITAALLSAPAAPAPSVAVAPVGTASASPAAAGEAGAVALARKVQAVYERTRDLEARFTQTYTYAALGRRQVSTGTLRVKRPGLMRWDYATPSVKTVAVNGSRLVQYEPDEKQAYVDEHFDASAMSAAVTFLLGQGDLVKSFSPALGEGGALVLTPRAPDPRVARVVLTVGPDGEVLATAVVDGAGNENRVAFEGLRRNVGLAEAAFQVALPPDVRRIAPPGR